MIADTGDWCQPSVVKILDFVLSSYLIFVANATNSVSVKILKWEEFFPYLTRKEPLWNLVISFHI